MTLLMNTRPHSIHPQLADMRPIARLRSGKLLMQQPCRLIAGIILGWLLHSAFQHLTQIQTAIP
jgi:hypothetical protein